MEWRVREAITAPAVSKAGALVRGFCSCTSQELCIFSTLAATALENPVVVNTSRSIKSVDTAFFRYNVNPPNLLPLRFIRLKVKLQFVSDDAGAGPQKY